MPLDLIARYSLAAGLFSAAVTGVWLAVRKLRGDGWPGWRAVALTAYLAALIQITALRLGLVSPRWLGGMLKPVPLGTTLEEARRGTWPLIYHALGNMGWFVPLGLLMPGENGRQGALRCLALGLTLSVAIEATQFLLGTGVSDVDDVLLNTLGTLAGRTLSRLRR